MYKSLSKIPILTLTIVAAVDIGKCLAVALDGTVASAGSHMFGLSDVNNYAGDNMAVDVLGTSVATAGAAITKDAVLEVGTGGKLIPLSSGKPVARALTGATGDGNLLEVLLLPASS